MLSLVLMLHHFHNTLIMSKKDAKVSEAQLPMPPLVKLFVGVLEWDGYNTWHFLVKETMQAYIAFLRERPRNAIISGCVSAGR